MGSRRRRILGVDVGLRHSYYVITYDRKVVERGELNLNHPLEVDLAGIDAPLSLPKTGILRECEMKLYKLGIGLFPSGAEFFKPITLRGIEIAEFLKRHSVEVFEVYPFATRKILNIAPKSKKNRKSGLERIKSELRRYIEFDDLENSDLVDAAIAALTVELYIEGKAEFVSGKDGSILIPRRDIEV